MDAWRDGMDEGGELVAPDENIRRPICVTPPKEHYTFPLPHLRGVTECTVPSPGPV